MPLRANDIIAVYRNERRFPVPLWELEQFVSAQIPSGRPGLPGTNGTNGSNGSNGLGAVSSGNATNNYANNQVLGARSQNTVGSGYMLCNIYMVPVTLGTGTMVMELQWDDGTYTQNLTLPTVDLSSSVPVQVSVFCKLAGGGGQNVKATMTFAIGSGSPQVQVSEEYLEMA